MDTELADKLFRAYRTGLLFRPAARCYRARPYDFLFRQVFWLKIPLLERAPIWRLWGASTTGLRLSRELRLDAAGEAFRSCWAELADAHLSRSGRLLALTFLESAHAYWEHKRGAFDLARARILRSMDADLELQEDRDFDLLELHRLQSAQNLMRIDLRDGEPRRALGLAGRILSYIEGLGEELPVHRGWRGSRLMATTPRPVRHALLAQVANEAALALARDPLRRGEEELLANVQLERRRDLSAGLHEQLRLWLLARHAFRRRDWDHYASLLLELLPLGRTELQALWYCTVVDLLAFCHEGDSPAAERLRAGVLRDVPKWPGLPAALCPQVGLPPREEPRAQPDLQAAGFTAPSSLRGTA